MYYTAFKHERKTLELRDKSGSQRPPRSDTEGRKNKASIGTFVNLIVIFVKNTLSGASTSHGETLKINFRCL